MPKLTLGALLSALIAFALPVARARAESVQNSLLRDGDGAPLCLDVAGGKAAKGTNLLLFRCHGGQNQRFTYNRQTGELRSALGDFCVDVNKGEAFSGNRVQLWSCNGSNAQKFDYDARNERVTFRDNRALCLEVPNGASEARLAECNGRAQQRFDLTTRHGNARFDELTFLTAHNAFANNDDSNWAVPNQSRGISSALADGVRGFMLDVHSFESGTARCVASFGSDCYGRDVYLCHGNCGGVPGIGYALPRQTLADSLRKIVSFMQANPEELVTVFLEDYVGTDELRRVLDSVGGLYDLMFDPYAWNVRENGWPRASAMVNAGDRLLIISDRSDKRSLGVAFAQDFTVENYWSMGGLDPDYSCRTRWDHLPLDRTEPAFNRLFVMNHFRDVATPVSAGIDNQYDSLTVRMEAHCVPAAKKKPNYIAVDFYERSDARAVAADVNDSAAILFEHGSFGGRAQLLGSGVYNASDLSVGNDKASSLVVSPGATVILYEHDGRAGRAKTFTGSASSVGDFNDAASSLIVLRDPPDTVQHARFTGDFDGDERADQLVYYGQTGDLFLGRSEGTRLAWSAAGNLAGFGNLRSGRHAMFARDFTGDGKTDLLFYYNGDGNIWLGRSEGRSFSWSLAASVPGFGNLLGPAHQLYAGDFNGDGKSDLAFYYAGNGDIWFGLSNGTSLSFRRAANVASFGNLLDSQHEVHLGDFNGDHKMDLAFYAADKGDLWLGLSSGTDLAFAHAGNIAGFGNLLSHDRRRFVGDFNGDGTTDLAFYYAGNGDLWLGACDGKQFSFSRASNVGGFGNLLDASRDIYPGDYNGDGKLDLAFHYNGNGDTWLGISQGTSFSWQRGSAVKGQGNLLDLGRSLVSADVDGDGRTDLLSYSAAHGSWRLGRSTGAALSWTEAGSSAFLGDFSR